MGGGLVRCSTLVNARFRPRVFAQCLLAWVPGRPLGAAACGPGVPAERESVYHLGLAGRIGRSRGADMELNRETILQNSASGGPRLMSKVIQEAPAAP
jgi:hypothetical protein